MRSLATFAAALGLATGGGVASGGESMPYCSPAIFATPAPAPFGTAAGALDCRPVTVAAPHGTLTLALARTEPDRERGLMLVRWLPRRAGMIFAFSGERTHNFWMKDTLISLDMIFVNARGVVTSVAADVPASTLDTPNDRVADRSGFARYVIELGAGVARSVGLRPGVRLAIPPIAGVE